jgi:hypothetical protein
MSYTGGIAQKIRLANYKSSSAYTALDFTDIYRHIIPSPTSWDVRGKTADNSWKKSENGIVDREQVRSEAPPPKVVGD